MPPLGDRWIEAARHHEGEGLECTMKQGVGGCALATHYDAPPLAEKVENIRQKVANDEILN